uniref:Uncharacterized protein n=1 Tax=Rhizophora mucronata TaxID=61149 RepID=A0A2P2PZN2_RHIMU
MELRNIFYEDGISWDRLPMSTIWERERWNLSPFH